MLHKVDRADYLFKEFNKFIESREEYYMELWKTGEITKESLDKCKGSYRELQTLKEEFIRVYKSMYDE